MAEYKPRMASRFVGTLTHLLSTKFTTDVEADLPAFEKMTRRYEQETGAPLDDQIKVGIVMNAVTDPGLRDHLIRNSVRLKTYSALKEELLEVARASRVLNSSPTPMDIGAVPGKGRGKTKGKEKGKGKGQKGASKGNTQNPNKDKECHYCHKMGHISSECRKKARDEAEKKKNNNKGKDKGKGSGGKNRPHAASPAEEPEPLSATPAEDPDYVAALTLEASQGSEVLVDTGAGSHLFVKGFDPNSQVVGSGVGKGLVTVTGEPLSVGPKRKSVVQARNGQSFSIEYNESEKINFSVLSSGQAASKGCWTIIGPNKQCLVLDKHAETLRKALDCTESIPLEKKRGVYWLPLKGSDKAPEEVPVLAAARAAKKTVPAKAVDAEEMEDGGEAGGPAASSAGGPAEGPGAGGPAQEPPQQEVAEQMPQVGEPPAEVSESTRKPKAKKIPDLVSEAEYNEHMLTHLPFRNWCESCVAGKSREDPHPLRDPKELKGQVPRVCMDYCFLGRALKGEIPKEAKDLKTPVDDQDGLLPILVMVDQETGCILSAVCSKGVNTYATHMANEFLKFLGRQKVILVTDGEPSIKALAEAVAKQIGTGAQLLNVPKETHGPSNGAAERAVLEVARQVRTLVHAVESKYPTLHITNETTLYPWLVRHAGWLITRYLVKVDGRTPYGRLRGREFKGEVVEALETVQYKIDKDRRGKLDPQTSIGIWLGKSLQSDEHLIGTDLGIRRCRSVWRRAGPKRWDLSKLKAVVGTPWQPKGDATMVPGTPGAVAPGTPGESLARRERSVYITLDRQIKHGPTPGCPGCHCDADNPKPRNPECRERFSKLYPKASETLEGKPGADAGGTAHPGSSENSPMDADSPAPAEKATSTSKRTTSEPSGPSTKAAKPTTKTGEKRAAEKPLEEVVDDDLLKELFGSLPTLHEVPPVAGYPETGTVAQAYDERTGEELPLEKVKAARGRELDKMVEHQVKTDITWEEAKRRNLKVVRSRWVDGWKPLPNDPDGVRSRCVAQEINNYARDDVSSGTPPLKAHRMVLAHAATRRPEEGENRKLIGRYDVSVAFFHAEATGKIAVVPPKDVDEGHLWYLLKAMNGTREASKQWSVKITKTKRKHGFLEIANVPGLFYHPVHDLLVSCHGDDFLASGTKEALDFLDAIMVQEYETKVLPRIGAPEHGGHCREGYHLHRKITWSPRGFSWEADKKYADVLVTELGLRGAKGVDTPASKDCGKSDRDAEKELSAEEASVFRKLAGTALYLSLDRPTIQFAVSDITSGMAKPLRLHMHKLRRLGRYLIKHPREVWNFEFQMAPKELVVFTDSDWASDTRTRKSMSCYVEMFGKHMIEASCARQATVALSSGEAEYYALTRGIAAALMSQQVWDVGFSRLLHDPDFSFLDVVLEP